MAFGNHGKTSIKLIVFLTGIILISLVISHQDVPATMIRIMRDHPLAPILFFCIYCIAGFIFIPTTILKIAGGTIFGPGHGFLYCLVGTSLGISSGFFLARLLGAGFIQEYVVPKKYLPLREALLKKREPLILAFRIVPGVPYNVINILAGLLELRFWIYFPVSIIGTLPSLFLWTYFAGEITENLLRHQDLFYTLVFFLMVLFIFLLMVLIIRKYAWPKLPAGDREV